MTELSGVSSTRGSTLTAGIAWVVLNTLAFAFVTIIVRIVGPDVPAPQTAFLRFFFGALLVLPIIGRLRRFPPSRAGWGLLGLRGIVHGIAIMCWFYALARVPTAEVTAIGFISPLLITLGAAYFFKESLSPRRIAALFVGLIGALIMLRPGVQQFSNGQLAQLAAIPFFAASFLASKQLSKNMPADFIVGALSVVVALMLLPIALLVWQPIALSSVAWLALAAALATVGHYSAVRAMSNVPLSVMMSIGFLQLLWAVLLGWIIFGDTLDPAVIVGGVIVLAAAGTISRSEMAAKLEPFVAPLPPISDSKPDEEG